MRGRLARCVAVLICHIFLCARLALVMGWRPAVLLFVAPRFRDSQNAARKKVICQRCLRQVAASGRTAHPVRTGRVANVQDIP